MKRKLTVTVQSLQTSIVRVLKNYKSTAGRHLQVKTKQALTERIRQDLRLTARHVIGGQDLQTAIDQAIKAGQIEQTPNGGLVFIPPKPPK